MASAVPEKARSDKSMDSDTTERTPGLGGTSGTSLAEELGSTSGGNTSTSAQHSSTGLGVGGTSGGQGGGSSGTSSSQK
ncbi:unnamed protein product [Didymodactylos carnosus]|uniref:Uncharacterized protein n=2 Tax=Didymodactylos carnosus TaxID=1234261 RepID=A0A814KWG2_9BILA|nr:unnamed protein product [Didymodactylos carnosus]CAF3825642.1 unnamed protein product [Didymodactylos carnosus]